jgi:uncharacterized protein YqhQ
MRIFLGLIALLSYLLAAAVFAVAPSSVQEIFSAIAATCGTVALVGAGIIERLDIIAGKLGPEKAKPVAGDEPWA